MNKAAADFFDRGTPGAYDERNKKLAAIAENLRFLTALVLKELPTNARILCVGVGTGLEIVSLASANPGWSFVGIDPSSRMLEDGKANLEKVGLLSRCQLFQGYLQEFSSPQKYDAVVCLLVMHFVRDPQERARMFVDMASHLKPGGLLVNAEISYDLNAPEFPNILEKWKQVQLVMGASPESLATITQTLRDQLLLLPPAETMALIEKAGFSSVIQFFQSILIHAWYAQKNQLA